MHIQKGVGVCPLFLLLVLKSRIQQFDSLKTFKTIIIILQEAIVSLKKTLIIQINLYYGASMDVNKHHCCHDKTSPLGKKRSHCIRQAVQFLPLNAQIALCSEIAEKETTY